MLRVFAGYFGSAVFRTGGAGILALLRLTGAEWHSPSRTLVRVRPLPVHGEQHGKVEVTSMTDRTRVANFTAVIADRQSFLDGGRQFTMEGEDQPPTGWRVMLSFRWPVQSEAVTEGDLTLVEPRGAALQGSLSAGRASEITDEEGNVNAGQFDFTFDVTGGEGGFQRATGTVHVTGTLAGQGEGTGGSFEGEGVLLTVEYTIEGAEGIWDAPPELIVPTGAPDRIVEG